MFISAIETNRLRLEPLSMQHSQGMFHLWSNSEVTWYSGIVKDYDGIVIEMPVRNKQDSNLIIDFWIKAAEEGWGFRWAVILKSENVFTGTVGFNSVSGCYEIAYHLIPAYWGKGIMTEASLAAISWAEENGASEIEAFAEPQNIPSIALAERLGMEATDTYSEGARRYRRIYQG